MNHDLVLKKGKYAGKTIRQILDINPSYISWAEENAPGLLKENVPTQNTNNTNTQQDSGRLSSLEPNLDFLNQKF